MNNSNTIYIAVISLVTNYRKNHDTDTIVDVFKTKQEA